MHFTRTETKQWAARQIRDLCKCPLTPATEECFQVVAEAAAQHPQLVEEALIHDMQQVAGTCRPAGAPRTPA